jgi:short-subunit dehydrogenase
MEFKNKVVLITGASSGIGLACAEAFARKGSDLVLAARRYVDLCTISQDFENRYGIKAIAVATDVASEESCKELVHQAIATFGRIDILINNAGISMKALFNEVHLDVLRQLMDINFWGTVYCTKYALPTLIQNQGTLVGISSIAGFQGLPGRSGYSASKFAMQGFLESIRLENKKSGLQVLIACPGFTASNIRKVALDQAGLPTGESGREEHKMMSSEEVATEILNAIDKGQKEIILTSQGKIVALLKKFVPRFVDNMVIRTFEKEKRSVVK